MSVALVLPDLATENIHCRSYVPCAMRVPYASIEGLVSCRRVRFRRCAVWAGFLGGSSVYGPAGRT
jgi:hypothetical protein